MCTVTFIARRNGYCLGMNRDEKLARPWAIPGTPGLEHRIGGLERQHRTGNISYTATTTS